MTRLDRWIAGVAGVLIAALALGAFVLSWLGRNLDVSDIGWLAGQTSFAAVGAMILSRQPRNVVGRILVASGVFGLAQALAWRYADYGLRAGGDLPLHVTAAWIGGWVYVPMFALFLVALPLYFPTGRLPSRRWRPVVWATAALTVVVSAYQATAPGPLEDLPVDNPYASGVTARAAQTLDAVGGDDALLSLFFVCTIAAAVSLVLRYRRARNVERLQLKWFVWSIGALIGYLIVSAFVFEALLNRPTSTLSDLVGLVFLLCVPVSIGVAVLRHRLFDIDRIVSRTVAYAVLTALLVGVYLAAVTTLTAVTAPVTGRSPVAVAAATLLAAALFGPARRRIQSAVDRRFNRARYDAVRTVDEYRGRLRDQVELDGVTADLLAAVDATVEPARATLWLRSEGGT